MQQTVEALRHHVTQHNRRVVLLATLTLLGSTTLWCATYAVLYWLTLLTLSAARGVDAQPPKHFAALFFYAALLLVACALWLRRAAPDERPRDEKRTVSYLADLLLALPRITLAIWGNLSAWQTLSERELEVAAELVDRMQRDGRVRLRGLPLEIPDRAERKKVLLALQLLELLEIRRADGELWLIPPPNSPFALPP